jgi:thiol-disulfide isomerase/thioredoxin
VDTARTRVGASTDNGRVRRPRLPAALLAAGLAAAGAGGVAGCTAAPAQPRPDAGQQRFVAGDGSIVVVPPARRRPAPRISGQLLDGTAYDAVPGAPAAAVVLNFWASWCAPCRAEAPGLERVWRETRPLGVRFVGVNIKDDRGAARVFERGKGMTYPSLYDQPGELAARFRGTLPPAAIPSTLVIDRRGRVAARGLGGLTADELARVVRGVAGEPA